MANSEAEEEEKQDTGVTAKPCPGVFSRGPKGLLFANEVLSNARNHWIGLNSKGFSSIGSENGPQTVDLFIYPTDMDSFSIAYGIG